MPRWRCGARLTRQAAAGLLHRRGREAGRPADLRRARVRAGAARLRPRLRRRACRRRSSRPGAAASAPELNSSNQVEGGGSRSSMRSSSDRRGPVRRRASAASRTRVSATGTAPPPRRRVRGRLWQDHLARRFHRGQAVSVQTCIRMPAAFSTRPCVERFAARSLSAPAGGCTLTTASTRRPCRRRRGRRIACRYGGAATRIGNGASAREKRASGTCARMMWPGRARSSVLKALGAGERCAWPSAVQVGHRVEAALAAGKSEGAGRAATPGRPGPWRPRRSPR